MDVQNLKILVSFDDKINVTSDMESFIEKCIKNEVSDDATVSRLYAINEITDDSDGIVIISDQLRKVGKGNESEFITLKDSKISEYHNEIISYGLSLGIPYYQFKKPTKKSKPEFIKHHFVSQVSMDDTSFMKITGVLTHDRLKSIIVRYASRMNIPIFASTPIDAMEFVYLANKYRLKLTVIYNERVDISTTLAPPTNKNGKIKFLYSRTDSKSITSIKQIDKICVTKIQDKFRVYDLFHKHDGIAFCSFIMNDGHNIKNLYLNMEG